MKKLAVVLFNLGGPDSPEAIRPFLFNLFNDPAIIGAPTPVRWALAQFISRRRAPVAREIYANLDGRSPLLPHTLDQATALQAALSGAADEVGVFIAMRYWHPLTAETVKRVKEFGADKVVLLPLYPQYSTTTSGSSIGEWTREAARQGLTADTVSVCCYPTDPGFVRAQAALLAETLDALEAERGDHPPPRVLFSAHGLPKKVIEAGDPYQWQVEQTSAAVAAHLDRPDLDWKVSYQSRVGPLEWIGPATDDEIQAAGAEKRPLVVVPIAFVSEHSETLVELDIEYGELAEQSGVPLYRRVSTVLSAPPFIEGLAGLVRQAAASGDTPVSEKGGRLCPGICGRCPNRAHAEAAAPATVAS
ncbi:ferrochelatase [Caenispirillum salinarum]|uniref:ferrochelatase n=1 Tax=Caenispirillum salinarum TaxID=859058 RepID=UPI00384C8122